MVAKGARNIVLLSRSGSVTGRVKELVDALGAVGANIVVRRCNVANRAEVDELINSGLSELPPIRGVVHGTMVLRVRLPSLKDLIRDILLTVLVGRSF
jgi:NAD(P)-dependent dehydrogenase (short-subunit alcohol dehydrogenase family)